MNTQRFCYGLIAACLTPWTLSSFAGAEAVSAYRGDKPTPFDVAVERGMSRAHARQLAGEPDARVGVDIWIYVDCRLTSDAARTSENDTLCIGFAGDRVAILKLVPLQAVRELVLTGRVVVLSNRLKVLLRDTARTAKTT